MSTSSSAFTDDGARDIAYWQFWHGARHSQSLLEGYETVLEIPNDIDERLDLYRLEIGLMYLGWFLRGATWRGAAELVTSNLIDATDRLHRQSS